MVNFEIRKVYGAKKKIVKGMWWKTKLRIKNLEINFFIFIYWGSQAIGIVNN